MKKLTVGIGALLFFLVGIQALGAAEEKPSPAESHAVVAAVSGWPITDRDLRVELLCESLSRGEVLPEIRALSEAGWNAKLPAESRQRLLRKLIERRLVLDDIERARRFRSNLPGREVENRGRALETLREKDEAWSGFARWIELEPDELVLKVREEMLANEYIDQELGVFGSSGKKVGEIYNNWMNILWNRAEIEIF